MSSRSSGASEPRSVIRPVSGGVFLYPSTGTLTSMGVLTLLLVLAALICGGLGLFRVVPDRALMACIAATCLAVAALLPALG